MGISLGINLLPTNRKYCNFNCIYCECGSNNEYQGKSSNLPLRETVYSALEKKLKEMQQDGSLPDSITFAGNGEPTCHPDFSEIIDDTVALRNSFASQSKISVLSNATMLERQETVSALRKIDMPVLKLDSAVDATIELLNQPSKNIGTNRLITQLTQLRNHCIIQTMFVQGTYLGRVVDNTSTEELEAWERAIISIQPKLVTIYSIARDTPVDTIHKVCGEKLKEIGAMVERHGIHVHVSA